MSSKTAPPLVERHAANSAGRTFVVSDIHGQYDNLMEVLASAGFDRKHDILYATGDLIDRGRDSFRCLSLPFEPWCRPVIGNHEILALDALREGGGQAWDNWMNNGGTWVYLEGVHEVKPLLEEATRYMPLAREFVVGNYRFGLVHAEPPWDWQQVIARPSTLKEQLTWGRERITAEETTWVEGIDAVFVGHTIVDEPIWMGNVLYTDTGAFLKEGRLTLLCVDDLIAGAYPTVGFPQKT